MPGRHSASGDCTLARCPPHGPCTLAAWLRCVYFSAHLPSVRANPHLDMLPSALLPSARRSRGRPRSMRSREGAQRREQAVRQGLSLASTRPPIGDIGEHKPGVSANSLCFSRYGEAQRGKAFSYGRRGPTTSSSWCSRDFIGSSTAAPASVNGRAVRQRDHSLID